ncbi:MAG: hypothetical protein AB8H79_00710 [Myxococcota bacterium]
MSKRVADTLPNDPPKSGTSPLLIVGVVLVLTALCGGGGLLCAFAAAGGMLFSIGAPSPQLVQGSQPGMGGGSVGGAGPITTGGLAPVGVKPNEIASLVPDRWHNVVSEPPTPLTAFDPVESLDWAKGLAKSWQSDVQLVRLDVDHIRLGQPLDLVNDEEAQADYWFFSPSQHELAQKAVEVTEKEIPTGIRLWIEEGKVQVMIDEIDPPGRFSRSGAKLEPFTGMAKGCNLPAVLKVALDHPETPRRPSYTLSMRTRFKGYFLIDVDPAEVDIDPKTCAVTKR